MMWRLRSAIQIRLLSPIMFYRPDKFHRKRAMNQSIDHQLIRNNAAALGMVHDLKLEGLKLILE